MSSLGLCYGFERTVWLLATSNGINGLFCTLAPSVPPWHCEIGLFCPFVRHYGAYKVNCVGYWGTFSFVTLSLCGSKWKGFDWQPASEVDCFVYNCQVHIQGLLVYTVHPTYFVLKKRMTKYPIIHFYCVAPHMHQNIKLTCTFHTNVSEMTD